MSRRAARIIDAVRAGDVEIARVALPAGGQMPRLALPEIEAQLVVKGAVRVASGRDDARMVARGKGIVRSLNSGVRVTATKDTELLTARVEGASARAWDRLGDGALEAMTRLYRAMTAGSATSREVHGLALIAIARAEAALAGHSAMPLEPAWMAAMIEQLNDTSERSSLSELAESLDLTRKQLTTTFRRVHGCSVGEYQRRARISAACLLMSDTTKSIGEIASAAGFADHAHFTKAFKRVVGVSPSAYRQAAGACNAPNGVATNVDPVGRYVVRSKTAHGEPYDGVVVIAPAGNSYTGVLQSSVMPDVPIDTVSVQGQRMVITARVPAGVAVFDVRLNGAELTGEWRLAGRATPVRGRRSK
jgi:AraC-like DNA-binding protein